MEKNSKTPKNKKSKMFLVLINTVFFILGFIKNHTKIVKTNINMENMSNFKNITKQYKETTQTISKGKNSLIKYKYFVKICV